jgi:hypothetical protein
MKERSAGTCRTWNCPLGVRSVHRAAAEAATAGKCAQGQPVVTNMVDELRLERPLGWTSPVALVIKLRPMGSRTMRRSRDAQYPAPDQPT